MPRPSPAPPGPPRRRTVAPRILSDDDIGSLRGEFQRMEEDVHRYVTIYMTALAVAVTWLLGPETVALPTLVSGNGGVNYYLLLFVVTLNTFYLCFLLHKGLLIHELAQFTALVSEDRSLAGQWEQWRRGRWSVARPVQELRHAILVAVPLSATAAVLTLTGMAVFGGSPPPAPLLRGPAPLIA